MEKKFDQFRNLVLCRRTMNQHKAFSVWREIRGAVPHDKVATFITEWTHYKLGELTTDEFGSEVKKLEKYFL